MSNPRPDPGGTPDNLVRTSETTEPQPQQERRLNMDPTNDICNCEFCETARKEQGHDPYFSDRDEFDRVQEEFLWPEADFDGDILDLL